MKEIKTILTGLLAALAVMCVCGLIAGCAGLNRNLYNAENLAVDTVGGAVHSFNEYYRTSTNGAAEGVVAKLNGEREALYATDLKFKAAVQAVDAIRLSVKTNSANTNLTALQISLASLTDQSSNILATVKLLISQH